MKIDDYPDDDAEDDDNDDDDDIFLYLFLAFDFCRFCVIIRFFHPRHNGQWMTTVKRHYIKTTGLIDLINSFFDRILRLLHLHPSPRIVVYYHGTLYVYNLSFLSLKSGYFRLQICSVATINVL